MIDYMEQERNLSKDLLENTSDRVIICICVDASMSMIQKGRKKNVDAGIKKFIQFCKEDTYAKDSVELCIITFGGDKAEIVQPFANVKSASFDGIHPNGNTPLGSAVLQAVNMIKERKEIINEYGRSAYKPWLIIMSDGKATDDTDESARIVNEMIKSRELKVKCIDMSEDNEKSDLEKYTLGGKIETIKGLEIQEFFSMLSRSASALSTQTPGRDEYDPIQKIGE